MGERDVTSTAFVVAVSVAAGLLGDWIADPDTRRRWQVARRARRVTSLRVDPETPRQRDEQLAHLNRLLLMYRSSELHAADRGIVLQREQARRDIDRTLREIAEVRIGTRTSSVLPSK
jgi:hypothetical protein